MSNSESSKKLILVVGATGVQGQAVIDALLAPGTNGSESPYAVRALTRDPGSKQALELKEKGVEVVKGSTEDFESIYRALDGAYGLYVNTDGFTVGDMQEIYSGIRIFETAKRVPTLRHYVYSNLPYALKLGGYSPDFKVDHLDGKARVADWMRSQPSVLSDKNGEFSWSLLNTGPYMELLFGGFFDPLHVRTDGTVVFAAPIGDAKLPMIALKDLGWWARYVFDHRDETSGRELSVTSDLVGWDHLAKTFTKVTGKPAVYKPQSLSDWLANFDPELINKPLATNVDPSSSSVPPTTLKENASAFWRALGSGFVFVKDINWIRSVHPETYTLERWMRDNKYSGRKGAVMKNSQEGRRSFGLNTAVVEKL